MVFIGQELDCIVNQMMHVAEYLGWDVTELRPVRNVSLNCINCWYPFIFYLYLLLYPIYTPPISNLHFHLYPIYIPPISDLYLHLCPMYASACIWDTKQDKESQPQGVSCTHFCVCTILTTVTNRPDVCLCVRGLFMYSKVNVVCCCLVTSCLFWFCKLLVS